MGTLPIFILVTLAILFGALVMVLCTFLGPKKPTPEKLAPYERADRTARLSADLDGWLHLRVA